MLPLFYRLFFQKDYTVFLMNGFRFFFCLINSELFLFLLEYRILQHFCLNGRWGTFSKTQNDEPNTIDTKRKLHKFDLRK